MIRRYLARLPQNRFVRDVSSRNSFQQFSWKNPDKYLSPYDIACPLDVVILYNPSPHANNVAVEDLLKTWPHLQIVQTVVEGRAPVVGAAHQIFIPKGSWGDMAVFKERFSQYQIKNRRVVSQRIGFYPVWSSMAEDSNIARAVESFGLHWIGATPESMDGLGKIEYKTFCEKNSLPTAPFFKISPEGKKDFTEATLDDLCREMTATFFERVKGSKFEGKKCFVKSEYGGGGRGTKKADPTPDSIENAIRGVLNETKKVDGIYVEAALDFEGANLYQIELEVDAGSIVEGGRLVYFNNRNQKMIELGFSSKEIVNFLPEHIYNGCVEATSVIARESKYNGRGTNEILIAKMANGEWCYYCSEFNKRIQVEHKALSYLKRYSNGELFNTVADQLTRSCGYRPPDYNTDLANSGGNAVAHIRFIAPSISKEGDVSFPVGVEIDESILPKGFNVHATLHTGKLFSDTDAQFGVALIRGENWQNLISNLQHFCKDCVILGKNVRRDYFRFLQKFFSDSRVENLSLSCNKTFDVLANDPQQDGRRAGVINYLSNGVANTVVNGYRPEAGVKDRGFPTQSQIDSFIDLRDKLIMMPVEADTPFLRFLQHLDENRYFDEIRSTLSAQGGGMVSVFPRDVQQESGSSESHIITPICRSLMERVGSSCGFVGYEQGGAQFQTAEMNLISSFKVMEEGLLSNLATFSLTRSHWMNALEKLNTEEVSFILDVTKKKILSRFHLPADTIVPYFPYNFHAGNVVEQDEVTSLMLDTGMIPVPNFVWDPRFTIEQFSTWVGRQLVLWRTKDRRLHAIRIKNAGQQREWTSSNVMKYIQCARSLFKKEYGDACEPIIHIHNHNFNGLASHVAYELLLSSQEVGFRTLIIDSAPPLMTHNNNLVVTRALKLSSEQKDILHFYNESAHTIWRITERFHDFLQVRIDPDTIWAGGTGSSDLAAAEKLGIPRSEIESAKFLGAQVSGLGGIVTPYSQWSMVIGYTCYKQNLKTFAKVKDHISAGKTIPLPKNIIEGLRDWKTLLPRPAHVEQLLANFDKESTGSPVKASTIFDKEKIIKVLKEKIPDAVISDEHIARLLAYGDIATKTISSEVTGNDNNWLLRYPELAYTKKISPGKVFAVRGIPVSLEGVESVSDTAQSIVTFKCEGRYVRIPTTDIERQRSISQIIQEQIPYADPTNTLHVGAFMPGVCESVAVKVGQVLKTGDILFSINSMKMVTAFKATSAHAGHVVDHIFASPGAELAFSQTGAAPLVLTLKK